MSHFDCKILSTLNSDIMNLNISSKKSISEREIERGSIVASVKRKMKVMIHIKNISAMLKLDDAAV